LAEQRRIVAQVELLLAELKACTEHLNKIPGTIKRFRLAVLAAACSGRLTDSWRSSRGEQGVRDTVETDIANSDEHLDVPAGWVHVRLEDVADDVSVGHVGPMAHEYVPNGVPFLRSQNVREFRYDPDGIKFISREFHEQLKKSQLRPGDVVVVRSGNAGVACVIPRTLKTANCSDLVIIRPSDRVVPEYLCLFINSAHARAHVEATKVGIAQGHFNIGDARKMILPLPPVAEQHEIVRNVDSLFAIADTIEEQFAAAAVRVAKTSQSVLAKAFRGELVPTEAELALEEGRDYESAAALLERIWQQPH
jgi:type I restriction enzyme S subunit